jgi:hypothetical protein
MIHAFDEHGSCVDAVQVHAGVPTIEMHVALIDARSRLAVIPPFLVSVLTGLNCEHSP